MPDIRGQFLQLDPEEAANPFFFKPESRAQLASLGATYGWPLIGIFIAGGENRETPDFILERHAFPSQSGSDLAGKLQTDLESQMQTVYKSRDADARFFWITCHVWNYKPAQDYLPRGTGNGDYEIYVSSSQPPANWWARR